MRQVQVKAVEFVLAGLELWAAADAVDRERAAEYEDRRRKEWEQLKASTGLTGPMPSTFAPAEGPMARPPIVGQLVEVMTDTRILGKLGEILGAREHAPAPDNLVEAPPVPAAWPTYSFIPPAK